MHEPRIGGSRAQEPPMDELRIGDAERDEVMAALREHFAAGRLTADELDERLDQALAARTVRDLRAITADLPESHGSDVRPFAAPGVGPREHAPWRHGAHAPWQHGDWRHGPWHWRPHADPMARPGPWGPPSRRSFGPPGHPHRHPPFPLILLAVLVVVSVVAGTAWPLFFAVKALLIGMIVFTVVRLARHRHHFRHSHRHGSHR